MALKRTELSPTDDAMLRDIGNKLDHPDEITDDQPSIEETNAELHRLDRIGHDQVTQRREALSIDSKALYEKNQLLYEDIGKKLFPLEKTNEVVEIMENSADCFTAFLGVFHDYEKGKIDEEELFVGMMKTKKVFEDILAQLKTFPERT